MQTWTAMTLTFVQSFTDEPQKQLSAGDGYNRSKQTVGIDGLEMALVQWGDYFGILTLIVAITEIDMPSYE